MIRSLLEKLSQLDRIQLRMIAASTMLALIFAQLIWWVIFFEMRYRKNIEKITEMNQVILSLANGDANHPKFGKYAVLENGAYRVNPELIRAQEEDYRQKLIMLISETTFFILLITYVSYRVLNSLRNEMKLVRDRTVFMNSVSHELKTPLASLLLNLQTLQKRKLDESKKEEMIIEGIEDVHRLSEQINNLLTASAFQRKKGHTIFSPGPDAAPIDIISEIKEYLQKNGRFHDRAGVNINTELPSSVRVKIHPDQFQKICSNIIQNSIQYSGETPKIDISVEVEAPKSNPFFKKKRYAVIRFTDNGPGIPQEERKNIFQPLYRLQKDSRTVRGSGMGLYIVYEMVKSAHGRVRAYSPKSGTGTVIEIRLPCAEV